MADELLNPGDRVRVRGVMRGTVKIRQCENERDPGAYVYSVEMDDGQYGAFYAPELTLIGRVDTGERSEAEKTLDRAWEDHDEGERIARERALHLTIGDGDEIDWLDSD
jgi:hypothetical protein